jgi:hypothetical protein
MDKKMIIAIIVGLLLIISVAAFSLGAFGQTTEVDNTFIKGTISGVAVEEESSLGILPDWAVFYADNNNAIGYDFAMFDSLEFMKGSLINVGGLEKVATEEYNGVKWDIYYLDLDLLDNASDDIISSFFDSSGYVCFASGKNGDYIILVNSPTVSSDNSTDSDLFKNYLEPLLKSITLKDPQNAPKEYELLNTTKEDYDLILNYIRDNGWEAIANQV